MDNSRAFLILVFIFYFPSLLLAQKEINTLEIGDSAPAFSLPGVDGKNQGRRFCSHLS